MTTQPTDEEIREMADGCKQCGDSRVGEMLEAWLAERQAARDGVTDEMVDKAMLAWSGYYCDCNDANVAGNNRDAMCAALQAVAQPITSVSDALNFLEEWALSGNILHGEDIQRFHATVERIAPNTKTAMTHDTKPRAFMWRRHGRDSWKYAKWIPISDEEVTEMRNRGWDVEVLYTSPQPQQAVPDGFQWIDGIPVHPWDKEWFIAELDNGDRVVLKALPDEYTYDFKTADETYLAKRRIKRWMQFPDSDFIAAPANNGKKEG